MKLPTYVRSLKGSLYFQRDYPTKLRHLTPKKTYTAPLGLKANNVTEACITKALTTALTDYEIHLRLIENSDPESFNKDEINMAALAWLRKRNLSVGQFEFYKPDPIIAAQEKREQRQMQPDAEDMAEMSASEFEELDYKKQRGEPLTAQDAIVGRAFEMIQKAAKAKPQELSGLWKYYVEHRKLDLNSRQGQRINRHWVRWINITGNQLIAANTIDRIHDGLDAFVELRASEGLKGSSIQRGMAEVLGCLRYCSKKFRFGWVIEPPAIPKSIKKRKVVMSQDEQKLLINKCLQTPQGSLAKVAACIILMLQGAAMASEIGRLKPEDIALDAALPHVVIRNDTKTKDRKRIIPIVLGLDYLKVHLADAIDWINRTNDSTPSNRIKALMGKLTGNDQLTGHCCRHTFRVNCEACGVPSTVTAAIGGWSGASLGLSNEMLSYGEDGLDGSEVVQQLYKSSLKIHKHLINIDKQKGGNNVVAFG